MPGSLPSLPFTWFLREITELFRILMTVKPGEAISCKQSNGEARINLLIRSREIRFGEKVSRIISLHRYPS